MKRSLSNKESNESNQSENEMEMKNDDFELIWSHLNYTIHTSWFQRWFKRVQGFKDVTKTKTVLTNVSGYVKSGELVAFMGPSGAGKSTLLECIVGKRNLGRTGDVLICGENVENVQVAFVAQKNDLISLLTVKESILFAAKLLIATELNNQTIESESSLSDICTRTTECLIVHLGLEVCENNRVSTISGGQLKRLAIAQQLVANPRILVLDEPTSGLDSLSCFQVVELLRTLAKEEPKMAIMLTIHQPSFKVLSLFDKIYVISKSGECIYDNKPMLIYSMISKSNIHCSVNCNLGDFIIEVASGEHGIEVMDTLVKENRNFYKTVFAIPETSRSLFSSRSNKSYPLLRHTMILFHRNLLVTIRNPFLFSLRFISSILVPIFMVSVFGSEIGVRGGCPPKFGSDFEPSQLKYISAEIETELKTIFKNVGNLFLISLFVVFNAILPTLMTFPVDMVVFKTEKANNWYGMNSFYFGSLLAEIPIHVLFNVVYWLVANSLQSQCVEWWRFSSSLVSHLLNSFITQSFGYIFGAIFMYNVPAAVVVGPLICCITTVLLCGVLIKVKSLSPFCEILSRICHLRFAIEALFVSIYGFNRCGDHSSNSLAEGREAFVVWMSAMLGVYGDSEQSSNEVVDNGTVADHNGTPSEKFVEELIDVISGRFISNENKVRSAVMNEFDLEDSYLSRAIVVLIAYLVVIRLIAYVVMAIKVRTNK